MLSQQVQALMEHSGLPTPAPAPAGIPALAAAAGLRPTGSASPAAEPTAAPPSGSGSDPTQLSSTPLPADAGAAEQTAGGNPSAAAVAAVELLVSAATSVGAADPPVSAFAVGSSSQLSAQRATSGLISGVSSLPSESVAQPAPSSTGDGTGGGNQNELVAKLTEYKVGARGQ